MYVYAHLHGRICVFGYIWYAYDCVYIHLYLHVYLSPARKQQKNSQHHAALLSRTGFVVLQSSSVQSQSSYAWRHTGPKALQSRFRAFRTARGHKSPPSTNRSRSELLTWNRPGPVQHWSWPALFTANRVVHVMHGYTLVCIYMHIYIYIYMYIYTLHIHTHKLSLE